MFKIGDKVALKSAPEYTFIIVGIDNGMYILSGRVSGSWDGDLVMVKAS